MTVSFVRIGAVACLLALTACGELTGPRNELTDAKRRWARVGPPNYEFTYSLFCFCGGDVWRPARVLVLNDAVVGAAYTDNGAEVPAEYLQFYPTIDELFAVVEDALARQPEHFDVDYHDDFGYPTRVEIDYRKGVADDEFTHRAFDLQPLPPPNIHGSARR
jgi:hypothetical protein